IHRFETLHSGERWDAVRRTLRQAAARHKLYLVLHPIADERLRHDPELKSELEGRGAVWLQRQPFARFAHWVANARFVICDSGGTQQECAYLGVPCLILRAVTETEMDPARTCVVLSRFEGPVIDRFLADPDAVRQPVAPLAQRPADTILDTLLAG